MEPHAATLCAVDVSAGCCIWYSHYHAEAPPPSWRARKPTLPRFFSIDLPLSGMGSCSLHASCLHPPFSSRYWMLLGGVSEIVKVVDHSKDRGSFEYVSFATMCLTVPYFCKRSASLAIHVAFLPLPLFPWFSTRHRT